jgi:hypothetical protein
MLDSERTYAVVAKKQRRGQAYQAAANNQNRDFNVRHGRAPMGKLRVVNHFWRL